MANDPTIQVEILFVSDRDEYSQNLLVTVNSTVDEVLKASETAAVAKDFISGNSLCVGIWGKRVKSSAVVQEGDRIEIYRPLKADPKELRRSGRLITKRK